MLFLQKNRTQCHCGGFGTKSQIPHDIVCCGLSKFRKHIDFSYYIRRASISSRILILILYFLILCGFSNLRKHIDFYYYIRKASNGSRILISISLFQLYLLNLTKINISGIDSMRVSSLNSILTT